MATRMQQRRGTAAEWTSANPILGAGEIGFETDNGQFKIGDGVSDWADLPYFTNSEDIQDLLDNIVDNAPELLNTLNELAAAIGDDPAFITTMNTSLSIVTGAVQDLEVVLSEKAVVIISNTEPTLGPDQQENLQQGDLWYDSSNGKVYIRYTEYDQADFWVEAGGPDQASDNIPGSFAADFPAEPEDGDVVNGYYYDESRNAWNIVRVPGLIDLKQIDINNVAEEDVLMYNATSDSWNNQPGIKLDENLKIPMTFMSLLEDEINSKISVLTVKSDTDWAADTSVPLAGSLNVELGSGLKFKLGNGIDTFANLEYVPTNDYIANEIAAIFNSPEFTGNVLLPSTTTIGNVTGTEIGYLGGVSSNIQDQIDDKAPIESPTFTGTVSGITSSMVGLGNADNTSDLDKPISTATQTALDGKLSLSGGTMTGKITLDSDPTQALHAVTKQYVDNVEAGLITRPAVKAATTANLSGTYNNGTAGVGATLNLGQLATLDIDGITSWSQWNGVLVKNQTNAFENGRYVVFQLGNDTDTDWILRRCPLCDEADEIPGSYIFVTDGTVNAQTGWVQHVDDPATFTVGTDDIDVYQFAGAGTVTAGTNISVSGNQVSVIDAPVFTGTVDASAAGVEFSDGIQTKVGVPSLTTFTEKTASYTLDSVNLSDSIIEMNSATPVTFTIPTNATLAWPVGASMDIFQTGVGEVTIVGDNGVTVNATPGLKLRTQWSSATILKRGTDSWVVYGDLKE